MKTARNTRVFQQIVYKHYQRAGRDFPWRKTANPYHILVSEIMLQQTRASRVVPYYQTFLEHFPSVDVLAQVQLSEVLSVWSGLGYNRRAKYLWGLAREVQRDYQGKLPKKSDELKKLPGIGMYTASAICVFAYNQPLPLIETNIRTALIYHFFLKRELVAEKELYAKAMKVLDIKNPCLWNTALMDYGACIKCTIGNENQKSDTYKKQSLFKGSGRELRGYIIKTLTKCQSRKISSLVEGSGRSEKEVKEKLHTLATEGFIKTSDGSVRLA